MHELLVDVRLRRGVRTHTLALRTSARAVAVLGPSGAGKSTLLRVLAGLERRAEGRVAFGGEVWQDAGRFVPPWQRGVGWVPQDGVLFPHLDVGANLAYAARMDIGPLAELLGIAGLLARRPRNLSGGERQRVALGRALASAPRLLLLDEPFAALDRPLRARLRVALDGWVRARGVPMVLVTHDPADAEALADEAWEFRGEGLERL